MAVREKDARGQNRTTKTDWSKVAPYIKFRYERARERLPTSGVVYELGCGIGVGLDHLARSRPDLQFVGFDNSSEAISFGSHAFSQTSNLKLVHTATLQDVLSKMNSRGFLVAMEVIEHLTDDELAYFKNRILSNIDGAAFSFPYMQTDIAGTNHLQSIDSFTIFEMFPGFQTLFMRRGSIKFIGYWKREDRTYVTLPLGIRGEEAAIRAIANWEVP